MLQAMRIHLDLPTPAPSDPAGSKDYLSYAEILGDVIYGGAIHDEASAKQAQGVLMVQRESIDRIAAIEEGDAQVLRQESLAMRCQEELADPALQGWARIDTEGRLMLAEAHIRHYRALRAHHICGLAILKDMLRGE